MTEAMNVAFFQTVQKDLMGEWQPRPWILFAVKTAFSDTSATAQSLLLK